MKNLKFINVIALILIITFSITIIVFCNSYLYPFLDNTRSFLNNNLVNLLATLNHNKIIVFLTTISWLFLIFLISRKFVKLKMIFTATVITLNLIYISWRIIFTIPTSNKIGMSIGILLIVAEFIGFFQSTIYSILFYKPYNLEEIKMDALKKLPTIDILIATFNEPSYILRKTIAGCLNIRYPSNLLNIYVCDDGNRDEIKKLSEFFGVNYITRNNNNHAKAGNINNALSNHCKSELFSVLDADMVPKPNYLEKMVGYFKKENIGFVQSPQVFYNPDPFQYNLNFNEKIPNEQDFFMREIQSGRARFNALFHVGTNALFSRKAIDSIGGIPIGSITEDMATGMLLQSKKYESIFVNETLAVGLSAEYYNDFAKQRKRWCRGNIQVSKKWNPLTMKGLTLMQRLLYFSGIIYWYSSILKMIYIICPIIYLIFGTLIVKADLINLLQFFIPSYISYILVFKSHSSKYRTLIFTHIYETATAPFLALSSLFELIFSKQLKFNVTLKGNTKKNFFISWELLIPQFILFVLTILGCGISINKMINTNSIGLKQSLIINLIWSGYNLIGVVMVILLALEKPRFRKSERKSVNTKGIILLPGNLSLNCDIKDISDSGIKFCINKNKISNFDIEDIVRIKIDKAYILCKLVRYEDNCFGCKFINLTKEQYLGIVNFIFENENGYYKSAITERTHFKTLDVFASNESLELLDDLFTAENENIINSNTTINDNNLVIPSKFINVKENTRIPLQIIESSDKTYSELSLEELLGNILNLKLSKEQIHIIKMHKELTDMRNNFNEPSQK